MRKKICAVAGAAGKTVLRSHHLRQNFQDPIRQTQTRRQPQTFDTIEIDKTGLFLTLFKNTSQIFKSFHSRFASAFLKFIKYITKGKHPNKGAYKYHV